MGHMHSISVSRARQADPYGAKADIHPFEESVGKGNAIVNATSQIKTLI